MCDKLMVLNFSKSFFHFSILDKKKMSNFENSKNFLEKNVIFGFRA